MTELEGYQPRRFDHQFKVVCIGNAGVGKSSLALRFCNDEWSPSYLTTIGVEFKYRVVDIEGMLIRLLIWDTAGQERYRTITQAYYRGSQGIVLVYDITDYSSFQGIRNWVNDLAASGYEDPKQVPRILIGNKLDVETNKRAVSTEQGRKLAEEIGALFYETSAKLSDGVNDAFKLLAKEIKKLRVDPYEKFSDVERKRKEELEFRKMKTSLVVVGEEGQEEKSNLKAKGLICCSS